MKISATIRSRPHVHQVSVQTDDAAKQMRIEAKATGLGSSVNGGELLLLSLATCFCNDIYREAAKRNITVASLEVEVTGNFGGEGEPGSDFTYKTHLVADATEAEIEDLVTYTDSVAEVHNTLRKGLAIKLVR